MLGRFVEKEIFKGIAFRVIPFLFVLFCESSAMFGQELPDELLDFIAGLVPEEHQMEAMIVSCEEAMLNPIDINTNDSARLAEVPFLTDYQIVSVWQYRKNYGNIVSAMELSLVSGFNEVIVARIRPFIYISSYSNVSRKARIYDDMLIRGGAKYQKEGNKDPHQILTKYKIRYGNLLQAGFTAKYPAFHSPHISTMGLALDKKRNYVLSSAVLGDFSARFGQGLVIWNSFSLSPSTPSSVYRKESKIVPYTSTDENKFYRGIGLSFRLFHNLDLSLFYSNNSTSKGLRDRVVAGNMSYKWKVLKLGLTYSACTNNLSSDFYLSLSGLRVFGELAFDKEWKSAALLGMILSKYEGLEVSAFLRYYSPYYKAPNAGAYSSLSTVSNQMGVGVNAKYFINRKLSLSFNGDYAYFPKPRYRIEDDSYDYYANLRLDYKNIVYMLLSLKRDIYLEKLRWGLRLNYIYAWDKGVKIETRAEGSYINSKPGVLTYVGLGYKGAGKKKWEVTTRVTAYYVDNWEGRIYSYERDVPGSFSVPFYHKKGFDCYLYGKIEFSKRAKLYLKVGSKRAKIQLKLSFF